MLTAIGQLKSVDVTMIIVGAELLWIVQETPASVTNVHTAAVSPSTRRVSMSGSPLSTEGEDSGDEYAASAERPKKRHPRFKPKPWDDSVTKFSLPKQKPTKKRSRAVAP